MDGQVCLGLRVVRGPDWEWGEQDGGEGHVGTVVELDVARKAVVVQWDCTERCLYRCGHDGKYDLRVFDRGPAGLRHYSVICSWCDNQPTGMLWKCAQCYDYFLCTQCYYADRHTVEHRFNRCDRLDHKVRTRVKARHYSKKLAAMGTFFESKVMRGADWQWENQDGGAGNTGKVTKVEGWAKQSSRSVVEVLWNGLTTKNIYRNGHMGKVDVKCVTPSFGGYYYPEHLEVLGATYIPSDKLELSAGDTVRVELDPDLFKIAQEQHGGWNDAMAEYIGRVGVVNSIQDCGDVVVRYSNNRIFLLNQLTLSKVDMPVFRYGDVVRISDDIVKVHNLQPGHGEWNDDIALSLGQIGRVIKVQGNNDVRVAVNGRRWVMNPKCMVPAPNQTPREDIVENVDIDKGAKLHILSLFQADVPDVVGTAAAVGDSATLFGYLSKHPEEVNTVLEGKGPLQLAVVEGFTSVLKTIIKFKPNLEMEDESGEKPLHICSYVNNGAAAKLLVDAGVDVNAKDVNGATPLSLSASMGHCNVVNALLESRETDINCQDSEGKTPLHSAITSQQKRSTHILLTSGANPTLLNLSLLSPYHNAASFGFLVGLEEFLRFYPEHVNQPKDDGYTPLHLVCANNYADLVSLIASHPSCDIDARTKSRLTALHIAVHEGHVKVVERLVGFGADLNKTTDDGNTALHIALGRNNMALPTDETPKIKAIQDEVEAEYGPNVVSPNVIVGMFLVSQGADTYTKNLKGVSPLQVQPADISELVSQCRSRRDRYHGSLKEKYRTFDEPPKHVKTRPVIHPRSAPVVGGAASAASDLRDIVNQSLPSRVGQLVLHEQTKAQQQMKDNTDHGSPRFETKSVKEFENRQNNQKFDSSVLSPKCEAYPELSRCYLCEKGADIQLCPCKHITLCHPCRDSVRMVKKCPQCRKPVSEFIPVCVQCQQNKPLTSCTPCEHRYCFDCKAGLDHCRACKLLADQEDT